MPSNPDLTAIAVPQDDIDQIIFTGTYSFTVNDTAATTTVFPIPGTFPDESLVTAIFSFDNGVSWNDAGSPVVFFDTSASKARGWIYCYSNDVVASIGKVEFQYRQAVVLNGGVPYTVQVKISVELNPKLTSYDNSISRFSGLNAYRSVDQYLKVAKKDIWYVPNSTTTTLTVAHNLGYVPFVSVFLKDNLFVGVVSSIINTFAVPVGSPYIYADATNLYITITAGVGNEVYYKIYSKG